MIAKKYALAGAAAAAMLCGTASAAVLDFTIPSGGFTVQSQFNVAGSTAPNFVGGGITSEAGFATIGLNVIGEDLVVVIFDQEGSGNPYFDANSSGKEGGLGNCRVLTASAQCNPNSDDNLTISQDETLGFNFLTSSFQNQYAVFGNFTFRDDDHNLINGFIQVSHDGGSSIIAVLNGIGDLSVIGSSDFLTFNNQPGATQNYYISEATISAVPVPAAVWLFGSALGLLGWSHRKITR